MESRQIVWFASECSEVLRTRSNGPFGRRQIRRGTESSDETDEGADNATGRLDNVDWCLKSCQVCRIINADCRGMSGLPSAPPSTTRNHEI